MGLAAESGRQKHERVTRGLSQKQAHLRANYIRAHQKDTCVRESTHIKAFSDSLSKPELK